MECDMNELKENRYPEFSFWNKEVSKKEKMVVANPEDIRIPDLLRALEIEPDSKRAGRTTARRIAGHALP